MEKEKFSERKSPRMKNFDYATPGYYFITVCCYNKKCLFREKGYLNDWGILAQEKLEMISKLYPSVRVDKAVVMPNHIHAILAIEQSKPNEQPSITKVVGQYKMTVTKKIRENSPGLKVWQRSFHDHVIRNQQEYERIWTYIHGNPQKWEEDCFFIEDDF